MRVGTISLVIAGIGAAAAVVSVVFFPILLMLVWMDSDGDGLRQLLLGATVATYICASWDIVIVCTSAAPRFHPLWIVALATTPWLANPCFFRRLLLDELRS